jgi:hypothetical protein
MNDINSASGLRAKGYVPVNATVYQHPTEHDTVVLPDAGGMFVFSGKPPLSTMLDSGLHPQLARLALILRDKPYTGTDLNKHMETILDVIHYAEQVMPGIGFEQCADAVDNSHICSEFIGDERE